MAHHASCGNIHRSLVWHCDQCGENESAEDVLDRLDAADANNRRVELERIALELSRKDAEIAKLRAALERIFKFKNAHPWVMVDHAWAAIDIAAMALE